MTLLVSGNLNPVELKRELDKLQRKLSGAYDKKLPIYQIYPL